MTRYELRERLTKKYVGMPVKEDAFQAITESYKVVQVNTKDNQVIHILLYIGTGAPPAFKSKIENIDVSRDNDEEKFAASDMDSICAVLDGVISC